MSATSSRSWLFILSVRGALSFEVVLLMTEGLRKLLFGYSSLSLLVSGLFVARISSRG